MVKDEMVKTLSAGEKHVAPVPHLDSEPLGNSDGDSAYFSYYAQLQHQAQMLQDSVRTSAYQHAILYHAPSHFRDKIVMDVGAGNGILSLFALQAGANKVFAVEASAMVRHLQMLVEAAKGQLADKPVDEDDKWYLQGQGFDITANNATSSNAWLAERLMPVSSKVEDVTPDRLDGNRKVDTIVSECLGVLLVHERMCESFIDARDRFLKPGGAMFPSAGTIRFAPIEDKAVWDEVATKARFWQNSNFYGVDLQPFFASAWKEAFGSPVVGCFNPHTLLSSTVDHAIDFQTISMEDLRKFEIPLDWTVRSTALVHGIGGWFDLFFQPESQGPKNDDLDSDVTEDCDLRASFGQPSNSTMTEPGDQLYGGLSVEAPAFRPLLSSDVATAVPAMASATGSQTDSTVMPSVAEGDSSTLSAAALEAVTATAAATTSLAASSSGYMSTSPYCTPTHWQQARLLFPEPLAVNRGQRLVGKMTFVVNENRSYNITADVSLRNGRSVARDVIDSNDRSIRRRFAWKLDRQTYSFTTTQ